MLVSEKYGKHLYAGRKNHTNINFSRTELNAFPNDKPCKKLSGQTPFITRSIPVAAVSRLFPHIVHVINFTSPKSQLFSVWSHTEQKPRKKESDHLGWMKVRALSHQPCNQNSPAPFLHELLKPGQTGTSLELETGSPEKGRLQVNKPANSCWIPELISQFPRLTGFFYSEWIIVWKIPFWGVIFCSKLMKKDIKTLCKINYEDILLEKELLNLKTTI